MDNGYKQTFQFWLEDDYFDKETKEELLAIRNDEKEVEDRFYKELEFGTGGLRGVIGAGTNRMNFYTVRKATQGLANYIKKQGGCEKGAAIAYDSRRYSPEFAMEAALCLCANGIKAYLFESLRPTPELSFAVRKLGCIAGIVVTASHNPPEYNGYKVYWEDGAQITAPKDKEIIGEVKAVTDYHTVKTMTEEEAKEKGLLTIIGKEIDDAYIEELKKQIIHPDVIGEMAEKIKIVYTPLHGTGNIPVRRVLSELGFQKVYVVKEQELPDSNFSTVSYPNPEDPAAFALALKLAKEVKADVILATDPDADRLGIYALDQKSGEYIPFTGNMSGMLIAEYILRERTKTNTMPLRPALVKTVVTTNMADALASHYHVELKEVLTGFKYIGEQIKWFEETGSNQYVFGLEESYGCLAGTHARDKDAVVAVMCLCEVAAYCKKQGITLWEQMLSLYETYGYFKEGLHTITLKGVSGQEQIGKIMEFLRSSQIEAFGSFRTVAVKDFLTGKALSLKDKAVFEVKLPKSDVIYFELENDAWCCVRPSGTEPKIKFYMGVKGTDLQDSEEKLEALKAALLEKLPDFTK
ncbi:MAG: phospho-sugar mutase [Roseburia sp.]|nr:phospho-sugar mutase [Roseburia sp.]MCM1278768.1 phospho-sugar mutase [Robinsoniella sp.]